MLQMTLQLGSVLPGIQVRKLRLREANTPPQVTQHRAGGQVRAESQSPCSFLNTWGFFKASGGLEGDLSRKKPVPKAQLRIY